MLAFFAHSALLCGCFIQGTPNASPRLVSLEKIWDAGKHNAFTDLVRWHDQFWCVFREGDGHVGGDGKIRVIRSSDGSTWGMMALIEENGIDLRDPKLSITPDGRLMLLAGGSVYEGTKTLKGRQPRVCFSSDGRKWTTPQRILKEGEWLWRVTWQGGVGYGISYRSGAKPTTRIIELVSTKNGLEYERIAELDVPGQPNESTLRFLPDGRMMAMVRREDDDKMGWLGVSEAPFKKWTWKSTRDRFGGPNFIVLPHGELWGTSRLHGAKVQTALARMQTTSYEPLLLLPSGGDCSYAGMVWHDGHLWISYYSSHEGKSCIYFAKIALGQK